MAVYSNPISPQREEEFNIWYNEVHLAELMQVPGFVAATRYRLADVDGSGAAPGHRYLALYEIEGEPGAAQAHLRARGGTMQISDALDGPGTSLAYWVPVPGGAISTDTATTDTTDTVSTAEPGSRP